MNAKEVPMGAALSYGWETFTQNAFFLVGVFAATAVVDWVLKAATSYHAIDGTYFEFVVNVVGCLVNVVLSMGLIAITLKFKDGANPEFGDLFGQAPKLFHFVAASILYGLMVVVGLVIFIVPGVYLALRFMFFGYFIVDQNAGPIEALSRSSALTTGVKMDLLFMMIMLTGIGIAGLIALGVGVFVALPVNYLALAFVYRRLLGTPPLSQDGVAAVAA